MASSPTFVAAAKTWQQQIATANTANDGSGTLGDIVAAGASGSRISSIRIQGVGAVTNGKIRFYLYDGANTRLWKERSVTTTTPTGTVLGWEDEITIPDGLNLPTGWHLKAAPHNAET